MLQATSGWKTLRPVPIHTASQSIPAITMLLCPCRRGDNARRRAATAALVSTLNSEPDEFGASEVILGEVIYEDLS